jgi:hypothetical protein
MALGEKSTTSPARGPRIAAWASSGLYLAAAIVWACTSWRATRGHSSAFATDLTGFALWGSLLVLLVVFQRFYPRRNVVLAQIVLGLVTLFSATQVVLDLVRRP